MPTLAANFQSISSPNGNFLYKTLSWGKLLSIANYATTPGSRRYGTNHTEMSLNASAKAPEKALTAQLSVSKAPPTSMSYGTGMYPMAAAKKSPTPR